MKVLIIDEDPKTIEAIELCFRLRWRDAVILVATDSEEALKPIEQNTLDLVISEVTLPEDDGIQPWQQIRRSSSVPVILLSSRDSDVDVARGLEAGADDYMTKPFSHIVLLARVNALLRRSGPPTGSRLTGIVASGDLRIDLLARQVYRGDEYIRLTPIEFRILDCLVRENGRVVPHQRILNEVWGADRGATTNQLKVHVQHLRQKLGDKSDYRIIVTEWRIGYKFGVLPLTETQEPSGVVIRTA